MEACKYDMICSEYKRRYNKILCSTCPNRCPYYVPEDDGIIKLTARQLGEAVLDAYMDADRYYKGRL